MTDLQIGIYFLAGMLTVACCGVLKSEKLVALIKHIIAALLAFATGYTVLSLVYFVLMRQLGPSLTVVFMLGLHKIIIFFIDGMIIAYLLAPSIWLKDQAGLLIGGRGLLSKLLRYFMAAYFICTGASKIVGFAAILGFFQLSGYPVLFLYFIIAFEVILGVVLLFRRTAAIAALMLIVEMAGATFTHYHNYLQHQVPEPFSNSLDSLKMMPFLLVIALIYNPNKPKSITSY